LREFQGVEDPSPWFPPRNSLRINTLWFCRGVSGIPSYRSVPIRAAGLPPLRQRSGAGSDQRSLPPGAATVAEPLPDSGA